MDWSDDSVRQLMVDSREVMASARELVGKARDAISFARSVLAQSERKLRDAVAQRALRERTAPEGFGFPPA